MSEPRISVVFLWHMHQPYYKDLVTGVYHLPWTRLHGLKDYYGMVAMLEEFPEVHQTFNLVPSLLLQLEDYAAGTARERIQEVAFKPASELTIEDRLFMLQYFFQANLDNLISRYPRYREMYDRMQENEFIPARAISFFGEQDFADLQVLSQLAWFDELFLAGDADIKALVSKGQCFSRSDQELLQRKDREAIGKILPAYRAAADRGQIEISTSPFYHPILPLLCDTNVATEPSPHLRLPSRRFRHPEDARLQLQRAIALHLRLLGRAPTGLWPSEGSVSAEALEICSSTGFRWIATDQQVLSNSLGVPFYRDASGILANADRLYCPYGFAAPSGEIGMLFRDHELSDLIGFVYSRTEPQAAAADFVRRIKQSAFPVLQQGRTPIVPVILDGENAWEYFPKNGREFLRTLYGMFSNDPQLECLTVSEALNRHTTFETLPKLAAGSWIDANFDIWIGAEEDNQAWDYLSDARDFFSERQELAAPEQRELALEELLIAEGSDWCWWYGPEHSTANDSDFDALYRSHLSNVYRALNQRPPDALGNPITLRRRQAVSVAPSSALSPSIDGLVTNYFEWIGAGYYNLIRPGGAMHGGNALLQEAYFGRNSQNFFLRIDIDPATAASIGSIRFRIAFQGSGTHTVTVNFPMGGEAGSHFGELRREGEVGSLPSSFGEAALQRIFELRVSLNAIGIGLSDPVAFQVSAWENGYLRETFPIEGWLSVPPLIDS